MSISDIETLLQGELSLVAVELSGRNLTVRVERSGKVQAIIASGLAEYAFRQEAKAQPRHFQLFSDHPLLLDYGPRAGIFGQAPLPDPYRFFLEFHKLVRDIISIPREPIHYLNWPGRMSEWLSIVYNRSYNLLTAPTAVAQGASELLDAQLCEHHILPEPPKIAASLQVLTTGTEWVIAEGFSVGD